jgi:uncharacterized protein (TIGR00251 family)
VILLQDHCEGVILPVRAQPAARREGIVGEHNGALKVAICAPPDQGRANKALQKTLGGALQLKQSQIVLLTGASSRNKRFLIRGLDRSELIRRMERCMTK